MTNLIVHKLNESYSVIDSDLKTLQILHDFLKVERPGAYFDPMVKSGFKSPYDYFASVQNQKLLVMNGHLQLLSNFGVPKEVLQSDFTEEQVDEFLVKVKNSLTFEPYDYQEQAFKESVLNVKQINKMCTSSGKSMTIALIAEFFRQQGKKGLLLVPNINLLTQFKNDIKDYNLTELYDDTHIIGGGASEKHFKNSLTISTWQSMQSWHDDLDQLDYVITDEAHRFASEETASIVKGTINCKYKWGFTGTLPEDPVMKMELFGLFGLPKTYITSRQLIDRGLATPIKINSIVFKYSTNDKAIFKEASKTTGRAQNGAYAKQLKFIKDHEKRNEFIVNLTCKLRNSGNTLVLGQHVEHLKTMYLDIMKKLYPNVIDIKDKDITGKKSFEFQRKFGVYYISGSDNAQTREHTRKILEDDFIKLTLEDNNEIFICGTEEVALTNGTKKLAKDLTVDDEVDDDFINNRLD